MALTSIFASILTEILGEHDSQDAWLTGAAIIWLTILAIYDVRRRTIPHIAWVALPCAAASLLSFRQGDWPLATSAIVLIALSERRCLPIAWRKPSLGVGCLAVAGLLARLAPEHLPGGAAVVGFWLMFELGWWAGADALAAMTLALLWPELNLLIALAAAHLGLGVWQRRPWSRLRVLRPSELEVVGQPGLPALALTVVIHAGLRGLTLA